MRINKNLKVFSKFKLAELSCRTGNGICKHMKLQLDAWVISLEQSPSFVSIIRSGHWVKVLTEEDGDTRERTWSAVRETENVGNLVNLSLKARTRSLHFLLIFWLWRFEDNKNSGKWFWGSLIKATNHICCLSNTKKASKMFAMFISKSLVPLDEFCDFTFYVHGKAFKVHRIGFAGEFQWTKSENFFL